MYMRRSMIYLWARMHVHRSLVRLRAHELMRCICLLLSLHLLLLQVL